MREKKIIEIIKLINHMIKRSYPMVGGTPKSNYIYRLGRIAGLEEIRNALLVEVQNEETNEAK